MQFTISSLEDSPLCKNWMATTSYFGTPSKLGQLEQTESDPLGIDLQDVGKQRSSDMKSQNEKLARKLDTSEMKNLLKMSQFQPRDFILQFFSGKQCSYIETVLNQGRASQASSQSKEGMAKHLYYYVRAQRDLKQTQAQFQNGQIPGRTEVEQFRDRIQKIYVDMREFFQLILDQSQQASNATTLNTKIMNYSYIFRAAQEIYQHQMNHEFDEIAHIVERVRKSGNFEGVSIFTKAIESIDKSLRNVTDSLKSRLMNSGYRSFNRAHCKLLLEISKGNPIYEMIQELNTKVRNTFGGEDLYKSCTVFEEAIPFWKVLCDTFEESAPLKYKEYEPNISPMLSNLIADFGSDNRRILENLRKRKNNCIEFNSELHAAVKRTYQMWAGLPKLPTKQGDLQIFTVRSTIQNWYVDLLRTTFHKIIASSNPGSTLIDFMTQLLDGSDLLSPQKWQSLITEPIYWMYDSIHEKSLDSNGDIVAALKSLDQLTQNRLDKIISQYNSVVKVKLPDDVTADLHRVGDQLHKFLLERLLKTLSATLNRHIYDGVFSSGIDWSQDDLPIQVDGFVIFVINHCLVCKCEWGNLYTILEKDIKYHVACSLLQVTQSIPNLSAAGKLRIEMDIDILRFVFSEEPAEIWQLCKKPLEKFTKTANSQIVRTHDEELFRAKKSKQIAALLYAEDKPMPKIEDLPPAPQEPKTAQPPAANQAPAGGAKPFTIDVDSIDFNALPQLGGGRRRRR